MAESPKNITSQEISKFEKEYKQLRKEVYNRFECKISKLKQERDTALNEMQTEYLQIKNELYKYFQPNSHSYEDKK